MEKNEFTTMFQTDEIYRALIGASRQLELCGWCPKTKDNKLNEYFYTCDIAKKDGVAACHKCIAEYFSIQAKAQHSLRVGSGWDKQKR